MCCALTAVADGLGGASYVIILRCCPLTATTFSTHDASSSCLSNLAITDSNCCTSLCFHPMQ